MPSSIILEATSIDFTKLAIPIGFLLRNAGRGIATAQRKRLQAGLDAHGAALSPTWRSQHEGHQPWRRTKSMVRSIRVVSTKRGKIGPNTTSVTIKPTGVDNAGYPNAMKATVAYRRHGVQLIGAQASDNAIMLKEIKKQYIGELKKRVKTMLRQQRIKLH